MDALDDIARAALNSHLERNGRVHVARGIAVVRPMRDAAASEPAPDTELASTRTTLTERVALRRAFEPLGAVEAELRKSAEAGHCGPRRRPTAEEARKRAEREATVSGITWTS